MLSLLIREALLSSNVNNLPVPTAVSHYFDNILEGVAEALSEMRKTGYNEQIEQLCSVVVTNEHLQFYGSLLAIISARVDCGMVPLNPQSFYHEGYELTGGLICLKDGIVVPEFILAFSVRMTSVSLAAEWLQMADQYLEWGQARRKQFAFSIKQNKAIWTQSRQAEAARNLIIGFD